MLRLALENSSALLIQSIFRGMRMFAPLSFTGHLLRQRYLVILASIRKQREMDAARKAAAAENEIEGMSVSKKTNE